MARKRKLKPAIKYSLYALLGILIISFVISIMPHKFDGVVSKNANAQSYSRGDCLIFFEKGMDKEAKKILTNLCDEEKDEEQVFDYDFKKYGKYSYLNYGQVDILVDEKMQVPTVNTISDQNAMMMISDYLRYTMKSQKLDYAYSLDFLEASYYTKLKAEMFKADIVGDDLHLYFDEYDVDVYVPLIYIGQYIGINLEANEKYIKPHFVDPNRKMICLTFDDGPSLEITPQIVNELYKYDGVGTFYLVGTRLDSSKNQLLADAISKANAFGSHTNNHPALTDLEAKEIFNEVNGPVDYMKKNFNYTITSYRPPYGAYNDEVDKNVPIAAVLWTVDSNDWQYDESKPIAKNILDYVYDGAIVILHDIYQASADSLIKEGTLKELVSQGYQLVNIDEYVAAKNISLSQGKHIGWD